MPKPDDGLYDKTCGHVDKLQESHTCLYFEDVGEDRITLCRCCVDCETECVLMTYDLLYM